MRNTWLLSEIVAMLVVLCSTGLAGASGESTIRVGLRYFGAASQMTVTANGAYTIRSTDARFFAPGNNVDTTTIVASADGLALVSGGSIKAIPCGSVTLSADSPDTLLTVTSLARKPRSYRGTLEFASKNGRLTLVNVVDIEDYLKGVLPAEMPASYPADALKAQAVAARTYAIANSRKHLNDNYSVCDQSDCQLYTGAASEREPCSKAIDSTRGLIICYNGKPASIMYSSDCGGATADYSASNPTRCHPYLSGVAEPEGVIHSNWTLTLSFKDIAARALRSGVKNCGGLTGLAISSRDRFGRAVALELTTQTAKSTISASAFRSALGVGVLKSTMFELECSEDGQVTFTGKGFGHGVGMCQKGARALALPPFSMSYREILAHYFPGTQITVWP